MPALALDLGEHLGYAYFDGLTLLDSGVIRLPTNELKATKKGPGMAVLGRRYSAIRKLIAGYEASGAKLCYYELTDWHLGAKKGESFKMRMIREARNRQAQRSLGRIEAFIESACVELQVRAIPCKVHDVKRTVTGNGNASKERVAKDVTLRFPQLKGKPQDEIDAVSVMLYAIQQSDVLWRLRPAQPEMP